MEKCAIKVFGGVPPMPPGSGAPGATPGAPGAPAAAMSPPSQSPQPELPLPNAEMLFSPAIRVSPHAKFVNKNYLNATCLY